MNDSDISKVTTLADMHLFENLKSIDFMKVFTQIDDIDLSNLHKLTSFTWLFSDSIEQIDLRNNSELTYLFLNCRNLSTLLLPDNCKIENFLVTGSKISSFDLRQLPKVKSISIADSPVRELDLTPCPNITALNIHATNIQTIDLSFCHQLEGIFCKECPYLTNIYISSIVKGSIRIDKDSQALVTYVEAHASIDPQGYLIIPDARFRDFLIQNYDSNSDGRLSQTEAERITAIDSKYDELNSLEGIQFMPNLQILSCKDSNLSMLDLSHNPKLETLVLTDNKLQMIDLTGCTELKRLICDNNELASIDLQKNSKLQILNLNKNRLNMLDLSGNPQLTSLSIQKNQIASIKPGNKPLLELIDCSDCASYEINLAGLPVLKSLICKGTMLSWLDLSQNPQVHTLDARNCYQLITIYLKQGQSIGNLQKENTTTIAYK